MKPSKTTKQKGVLYVISRNAAGRPTLQHKLPPGVSSVTSCSFDISEWSRHYMEERIEAILCRKPACWS